MAKAATSSADETEISTLSFEEREIRVKEREVWLKEQEAARNRWLSPLVVALVVAGLGALTNAAIAYFNMASDRELAAANAAAERESQERAAQAALILKSLDDGDILQAEERLKFLMGSGLVSDSQIVSSLISYLSSRWISRGPFADRALVEHEVCPGVKLFHPNLATMKTGFCDIVVSDLSDILDSKIEDLPKLFLNEDPVVSPVTCRGGKARLLSPFPTDATDIAGWCILVTGPTLWGAAPPGPPGGNEDRPRNGG